MATKLTSPLLALVMLFATGCATIQNTADALSAYEGRDIQSLIDRVGFPDRQETVLDKTAYYWGDQGVNDEYAEVCQLKAVAGADRIIVDTSVYGNIAGCERTIKKLR